MANEITQFTWRPGEVMNCGCIIKMEQEHQVQDGKKVLISETFISAVKCSVHQSIPDTELLGKLKNNPDAEVKLLSEAQFFLDNLDELWQEVFDQDTGKTRRELKPGKGFQILFIGPHPRKIIITTWGHVLTAAQKKEIKDAVKNRLGPGKENLIVYE